MGFTTNGGIAGLTATGPQLNAAVARNQSLAAGISYSSDSATVFGDSFSVGTGASNPATTGYLPLLAGAVGWTVTNHGVSGEQVADQIDNVYAENPTNTSRYVYYLGTNDQRIYTAANRQQIFQLGHLAALAWLGLPVSQNKLPATSASIVYSGTWNASDLFAIGKKSTVSGSTATATVYGKNVFVGYSAKDGNAGQFTITVDGVIHGTYNCYGAGNIQTNHGQTYTGQLAAIANLADGPHTVVVTVISATGAGNAVWLDWIAGTGGAISRQGPRVFIGNVPRMSAAGYATWGGSDGNVSRFNQMIEQNAAFLASMGLNVLLCDVAGIIDPATDLAADGLHPNDVGHAKIATAFKRIINDLPNLNERQSAQSQNPNIRWTPSTIQFFTDAGTGAAEKSRLDANGFLGIGTSSPLYGVHVVGNWPGGYHPGVAVSNLATANYNQVGFVGDVETWSVGTGNSANIYGVPNKFFVFDNTAYNTVGFKAMRFVVDTLGNIGIGSRAPGRRLEITSDDGNDLRLSYNADAGNATAYADFLVSAAGVLTIATTSGSIVTASTLQAGGYKSSDGSTGATGSFNTADANKTITVKNGLITSIA
jgi:lysophospholipase L1-like esterase